MKKLIFIIAVCAICMSGSTAFAQFSVRVNFTSQPIWGPVGYDYVEYYYLPDIQVYYYVPSHRYVYMERGRWVSHSYLPQRYRNYDVYHARKVVINESRPYLHHDTYRERYSRSNDYSNQESIRDSHEEKYYRNKSHPQHKKWMNDQRNNKYNQRNDQNNYNKKNNHPDQKKDQKQNNKKGNNKGHGHK